MANVQTDLNDLQQKFDEFEAPHDNAEKREGFVFVYSDESTSPSPIPDQQNESMSPSPIPDQQDESMDATIPHTTSESTTASVSPSHDMGLLMEIEPSTLPGTNKQNVDCSTSQCFTFSNESPSKCNDFALRTSTHYEPSTTVADCTQTKVQALSKSLLAGRPKSQLKLLDNAALHDSTNSSCSVSLETLSSTSEITEPPAKVSNQSTSAGTTPTLTNTSSELTLNSSTDTLSKVTNEVMSLGKPKTPAEFTSFNSTDTNDSTPTINAELASDTTTSGLAKDLSESPGNSQTVSKIASEGPTTNDAPNSINTNTSGNIVSDSASIRKTRMSRKVAIESTSTTTYNDSVRVAVTTRRRVKETSVPTSMPTSSNAISQPVVKMTLNELQVLKGKASQKHSSRSLR